MISATVQVGEVVIVAILAGLFALLGVRRGVYLELYLLAGVALGMLLADPLSKMMAPWLNLLWNIVQAVLQERATDTLQPLAQRQTLFTSPEQVRVLGSVVFGGIIMAAYELGRHSVRQRVNVVARVLGGLTGAINGYLVAFFLFPRHVHTDRPMTIVVPNPKILEVLHVNLITVVIGIVLVVLAFGVLTTRRGRRQE